ncbi:FIST signal transduction protein [Falsiroseomonas sp.]|uniref:FIST signal transduction protein n=1 Tax=Falsiroseomonas sp. TaxID=2870721 RepID=UPI002718C508|nr:FIST N-terminal domain-containing protein [Falsiroseomonas sp.]MDO9498451.1 FIST N-terminal domain-containing protein [Falsiroseomonas sp.]
MIRAANVKSSNPAVAARSCREGVGSDTPLMLLAFCGGKHDPDAVLAALTAEFGPVPIYGGSAAGVIGRDSFGYGGFEMGIVGFYDPSVVPQAVMTEALLGGVRAAGHALGQAVGGIASPDAAVMLLFDSVASRAPPRLHFASSVVEGFHDGFGTTPLQLFGGGLLTDMNLTGGWVFAGRRVLKHAAIALVFPPGIEVETVIMHGCRPISSFMEITRIDGADVFELDDQPALGVIERMLGLPLGQTRGQDLSLEVTLGQKQGDRYTPYHEGDYVNRLILRANAEAGSVTLFEPDFALGTVVQIMSRDNSLMLDSVRRGVAAMNGAVAGEDNLLALYIDCAGRASARSGAPVEEAELVAQGLDPSIPLLGFYSGVEVAPVGGGISRSLDWTGVLAVLRRRR